MARGPKNASDPKAISRDKQRQADAARNRRIVLERLLGDALGRKFLWDVIADAGVFAQTVDVGPSGHAVMCFAEGRKSFGLGLLTEVTTQWPQAYMLMTRENASVKLEDDNDGSSDDPSDS